MREMKYSGVEWMEDIPASWNMIRFKDKYQSIKEIAGESSSEYERLALTLGGVIKRPKDDSEGLQPKAFDGYQILRENDFVFKMIDLQNVSTSRVGLSPYTGLVSPAYIRFCSKNKNQFNKFVYYYLMSMYYNCVFNSLGGDGVRSALNASDMGMLMIPFPSEHEQMLIVEAIESQTDKVDALIANQEAQIVKLKAYKQSLITEVVTKGLNPNVPMKSSGVEAIGSIPQHWIIYRTKFVADAIFKGNGITKDEVVEDGDIQCIRYGEIYSKYDGSFEKTYSRTNESAITSPQYISSGDILFAGTGELVEEIGKNVVYTGKEPCLAGGDIIVLKHSQNPIFLNYALYCTSSQTQKSKGKAKLKVVHISASEIGNVIIALPPLDEQNAIEPRLQNSCSITLRMLKPLSVLWASTAVPHRAKLLSADSPDFFVLL